MEEGEREVERERESAVKLDPMPRVIPELSTKFKRLSSPSPRSLLPYPYLD